MKETIDRIKYLRALSIYLWLGTAVILVCIAVWPQQRIWELLLALMDVIAVLPMVIVERVKHCKVEYKYPVRYFILALVISTLVSIVFFQAVSYFQGMPVAVYDRENRFIWDTFPWNLQGLGLWFFAYNYLVQKKKSKI